MNKMPSTERCAAVDERCHLCSDDAVVGRITSVDVAVRTATVAFDGGSATVALDLIEANVGDRVLVHMGFAIERLEAS